LTKRYGGRKTNQRAAWNKSFAGRNNQCRGTCPTKIRETQVGKDRNYGEP